MLVREFLERTAEREPDALALVRGERAWTYAELDRDANRVAQALLARGVRRGDRVAVHLPSVPEAVIADFAALKAGACFVNLGRGLRRAKLTEILNDCGAVALISGAGVAAGGKLEAVVRDVPTLGLVVPLTTEKIPDGADRRRWIGLDEILETGPDTRPDVVNIDRDLACLVYTSGSTGTPKGIMADHDAVSFASASIIRYLELSARDVVLCALPLSFDYGLYQPLMGCRVGATTVLEESFAFPGQILSTIARQGVTGLPLVPSALALLLQLELERFELGTLRFVTNTGAALPLPQIRELRRRLPWVRIYSMYGLSETKRTLYLPPEEIDDHPDSVGRPIPGTEAWLEDADGQRVAPGGIGELVVRGRHVMRGYWNDPEETARRFVPGPLPGERICRTGDLFRQDEGGRFYFVARTDEVIKSRGEKVAPAEVERALHLHRKVAEACVVPVPDPIQGWAIKAFVVPRDRSLDERQLAAHCRRHLEEHMHPRRFEIVDALPRTEAGKIDRGALRDRSEAEGDRPAHARPRAPRPPGGGQRAEG
jgi:amino acid adenylation domain-containing protein